MKKLWILGCFWLWASMVAAQEGIFFWNVENFFDVADDSLTADEDFTPDGSMHWTPKRYAAKRSAIVKTIIQMGETTEGRFPMAIGLAEVENDGVLRDLCLGTPLRSLGYDFVHFDSPDRRGIDCALLFHTDALRLLQADAIAISDSCQHFFTRDILRAAFVTPQGDTLVFFVVHLPSKRGGEIAEQRRQALATRLMDSMTALQRRHPSVGIVAMGDFNDEAEEVGFGHTLEQEGFFVNLSLHRPLATWPAGAPVKGSYNYQGRWSCIDQIIVSRRLASEAKFFVFAPDRLLRYDSRSLTHKVNRTYQGPRYLGGVSDHLPVGSTLRF